MMLDQKTALDASDELDLDDIRQLVIRERGIIRLSPECAAGLRKLESLSLSHNALRSMQGFEHLQALVELNLNFNALTNADALGHCQKLRRVYFSNNELTSTSVFAKLRALDTLCLYCNKIVNLQSTIEDFRHSGNLKNLDLEGNPCASVDDYRFQIVKSLNWLETLDGDRLEQVQDTRAKIESLFHFDALDAHPLAATYLANHLLGPPADEVVDRASFVDRLRRDAEVHADTDHPVEQKLKHSKIYEDPYLIIRRLIQRVESLQSDLEVSRKLSIKSHQHDADTEEKIRLLEIENANMYHIRQDNQALRTELSEIKLRTRRIELENAQLKQQLSESHAQLQSVHLDTITGHNTSSASEYARPAEDDDANTTEVTQRSDDFEVSSSARMRPDAKSITQLDLSKLTHRRPLTGSREARLHKVALSSARQLPSPSPRGKIPPEPPSISDILSLHKIAADDDSRWPLTTPRTAWSDDNENKIVSTEHTHLLYEDGPPLAATAR